MNIATINTAPLTTEETLVFLSWALETYPDAIMPSAFNLNGTVLIDLANTVGYKNEIVFVDTAYHFTETLQTRDALAEGYPKLKFKTLTAGLEQDSNNPPLYSTNPDACCAIRKVAPLETYLEKQKPSAVINARSREQSSSRTGIETIEHTTPRIRINPLAHWSRQQLEDYAKEKNLPVNPLYWDGFLSIGCAPCTRAVRPGEDARAGRWAGTNKLECGLWTTTPERKQQ